MAFSDLFQTLYWKDIQYKTYEKILAEVLKTKIASFGHGSEQTVFPNCRITLTNQRIIISQKILWQNKYRVHYFIWLKDEQDVSTLNNGMIELSYSSSESQFENDVFKIVPKNTVFITKLIVYNKIIQSKYRFDL